MSEKLVIPAAEALGYAPAKRSSFVRRWWRAGLLFLVASALCAGWHWSTPWRPQLVYAYWQRQCLTYDRLPNAIAYDEVPDSAAAIRAVDARYLMPRRPVFNTSGDRPPPGWSPPAMFVPHPWEKLGSPDTGRDISAIAFMHARAIADTQRLTVVRLGPAGFGTDGHGVVFTARPYTPAPLVPNSRVLSPKRDWCLIVHLGPGQRLRVFAAQVDPDRSDHFTIKFEIDGQPGTIDGWLRDQTWAKGQAYRTWSTNDECVELRVRDGPGVWFENFVERKAKN